MSLLDFLEYKEETFSCKKCNWKGLGADAILGKQHTGSGYNLICPNEKCNAVITLLEYDTEPFFDRYKDILSKKLQYLEDSIRYKIESVDDLPEMEQLEGTIVFQEKQIDDKDFIIFTLNGKEIGREIRTYGYYTRLLELSELFKEKYGNRLRDIVPDVDGYHLLGDSPASTVLLKIMRFRIIDNFFRNNKDYVRGN